MAIPTPMPLCKSCGALRMLSASGRPCRCVRDTCVAVGGFHSYVASDDPKSAKLLSARPHRATVTYHQLSLPVFHVDKTKLRPNAGDLRTRFLQVIAEHQLLVMCDGWVMPGSG